MNLVFTWKGGGGDGPENEEKKYVENKEKKIETWNIIGGKN